MLQRQWEKSGPAGLTDAGNVFKKPATRRPSQTSSLFHRGFSFILASCIFAWGTYAWADTIHDGQIWFPIYNTITFPNKFRGWVEVNPRFGDDFSEIDQLLLRPALGYQIAKKFSVWQGYAWITNYRPDFTDEHRLYQELDYRDSFSHLRVFSRTRLEERFIRDAVGTALRAREMIRLDVPFGEHNVWAGVVYDEIFVNLNSIRNGPDSGIDQNRVFVGINRKVNEYLHVDLGYQNQFINSPGSDVADKMNHIILIQMFFNWSLD